MSRRGLLVLGTALVASSSIAILVTQVIAQGGSVTRRGPPPDADAILAQLPHVQEALEKGEAINIVPSARPDPTAQPFRRGPYRVVPSGFVGDLPHIRLADAPTDSGERSSDPEVLRASPLWAVPTAIPGGAPVPAPSRYYTDGTNVYVGAWYPVAGGELLVGRQRQFEDPIDILLDLGPDSALVYEFLELEDGRYAFLLYSRLSDGTSPPRDAENGGYRYARIHDPVTHIETIVEIVSGAPAFTPEAVLRIAESVR